MRGLDHKTVLITGGTGSFGKAVVEQLMKTNCKEVRIFSRDELKQEEMRVRCSNPRLKFYIGDVRDKASVDQAMAGADLVFHAAALKQVPSCEFFPMQAVQTNILGSHNVITSAIEHDIERLVCLSTDKAAYPVNAMGMSKALMEKVALAATLKLPNSATTVAIVRYGNVMCSRGSVIPLFIKQIKSGQPVTITVPYMTRFLLALSEAVELVLFAFENAEQGDLFIKKAPACTIGDLARAVSRLFGSDVPAQTIGIRHGEKIYETLATREELARADDMGDYYRIRSDNRDLDYQKYRQYFTEGNLREFEQADYTSHNTTRLGVEETIRLLERLPEVHEELDGWERPCVGLGREKETNAKAARRCA
ncbi:MAG TPA: UDP-glucose 4-epimerase [Planctomycetaceae bacterium]|nr:UDP-glucose 4-epimerase [Planctomycetaceae bacterium]